jgi:hypothetical protein
MLNYTCSSGSSHYSPSVWTSRLLGECGTWSFCTRFIGISLLKWLMQSFTWWEVSYLICNLRQQSSISNLSKSTSKNSTNSSRILVVSKNDWHSWCFRLEYEAKEADHSWSDSSQSTLVSFSGDLSVDLFMSIFCDRRFLLCRALILYSESLNISLAIYSTFLLITPCPIPCNMS